MPRHNIYVQECNRCKLYEQINLGKRLHLSGAPALIMNREKAKTDCKTSASCHDTRMRSANKKGRQLCWGKNYVVCFEHGGYNRNFLSFRTVKKNVAK